MMHQGGTKGVCLQSVACFIWAAFLLVFIRPPKDAKLAPFTAYWKPAVTNSIGPACGFEALKNISYPAQVSLFHFAGFFSLLSPLIAVLAYFREG